MSDQTPQPDTTPPGLEIDGSNLDVERFRRIVLGGEPCRLSATARQRVTRGRQVVESVLATGEVIYGLNTGFGDLANVRIDAGKLASLQERLVRSHAAGVGEPLPAAAVRGMLLLRANTLARGHSGARPRVVERLLEMLRRDLLPVVPSQGSVGASGDLAPLAHLALPILGRGRVTYDGREMDSAEALQDAGLEPLELAPKEGLALINGTQAMTSLLALSVVEARRLVRVADLVGGLSTDALRGTDAAFDARLHALRPHPGQVTSAANLWTLLQGSSIRESHRTEDVRVQDPYSLRCMPQVHGAARDLLTDVEAKLVREMNSVTDNPLVFWEEETEVETEAARDGAGEIRGGQLLSGGNFHGEPMAFAADILALGLAELAAISERRTEKLTNTHFSALPPFLVEEAGLNSGFMIAQVTAAALVSENKGLCHPASVDSIPTSADKEDHVSMGMGAALKLRRVVENTRRVLAIELAAAAQGIDLLRPLRSSDHLEALHREVRRRIEPWTEDREMAPDLAAMDEYLKGAIDPRLEGLG